jgi:DNA/RNA-binding domain of Phe-tRNA-synthetase-like protein
VSTETEPLLGWLAAELAAELPELRLLSVDATIKRKEAATAPSPLDVRERLLALSNRFRGARAVALRREPIPAAYRVFFRHIGLDPDLVHTPIEAAVLERMLRGGFLSGGLLEDVLLVALIDTSVAVWALDADSLEGPLGIRPTREGEPLGGGGEAAELPAGRLVVADSTRALASLFGEPAAPHAADAGTRELKLFAIQVAGVPTVYVEEALWTARAALEQP